MHDDHAYVLGMLGWFLSEKRLEHIKNKKRKKNITNLADRLPIRTAKRHSYFD